MVHRGWVVDASHLTAAIAAQFARDARAMFPVGRHGRAALADFGELERRRDVVAFPAGHGRLHLVVSLKLLQVKFRELRFGVERVYVARPALHHEEDTRLRLCGYV